MMTKPKSDFSIASLLQTPRQIVAALLALRAAPKVENILDALPESFGLQVKGMRSVFEAAAAAPAPVVGGDMRPDTVVWF